MRKLSLRSKKVIATVFKVLGIIFMIFGLIILLPWLFVAGYQIATHIHMGAVEMTDSLRLFLLGWQLAGAAPMAIGGLIFLKAGNVLQRIEWRTQQ